MQKPYINGSITLPNAAKYDTIGNGALTEYSPLVILFIKLGWVWGGYWKNSKWYINYQHSEKNNVGLTEVQ